MGHALVVWLGPNRLSALLRAAVGLALGPWPNLPLPIPIHTRLCAPIRFERSGRAAAQDRAYVDACYEQVVLQMQWELDRLVQEQGGLH